MENRSVRRVFWIVLGCGVVLWIILGITLPRENFPLNTLFDVFSVAAFLMSFVFVAIYTIAGLIGPAPRSRWWKNEVGTFLVLSFAAIMFIVGPVALAVLFNGGLINTWWWAWIWLGGHVMATFMIGSLVYLWIRNSMLERRGQKAN